MIIKRTSNDTFEVKVIVHSIEHGNCNIDKYSGRDKFEKTTLKLRCTDCTIMVFNKNRDLFKNISVGDTFSAIVKEWKKNIYNFKKMC